MVIYTSKTYIVFMNIPCIGLSSQSYNFGVKHDDKLRNCGFKI